MAHAHAITLDPNQAGLRLEGLTGKLVGIGAVLAIIGGAAAYYLGFLNPATVPLFYHAYLTAYCFFLTITLGALFFVILQHLSRAGWSVTVRRLAEGMAGNVVLMAVLFLPLVTGMHTLYHWTHDGLTDPASPYYDKIIAGKAAYLNITAFYIRMAAYFVVWILLAFYFRGLSARQDSTGDARLSVMMEKVSAPGMILFGFSLTFAFFDLLMSLNPHWFSTIFGVYLFAGSVLSFLVVVTLLSLWLQNNNRVKNEITTEHYHDLGKLTFAFTFFWGYIAFSQYMLIWYANIPEETMFYIPRQLGGWAVVSIVLVLSHFAIPFLGLISRHAKRRLAIYTFFGVWLLLAHLLDIFYLVMPNFFTDKIPSLVAEATHEHVHLQEALRIMVVSPHNIYQLDPAYQSFWPVINLPLQPASVLLVVSLVVGMGGLYMISTAVLLSGRSLVPLKDPRLPEALSFENA